LAQAFYDAEYLFTVNEDVFIPPPKSKNQAFCDCAEREKFHSGMQMRKLLFTVVKNRLSNNAEKTLRKQFKKL